MKELSLLAVRNLDHLLTPGTHLKSKGRSSFDDTLSPTRTVPANRRARRSLSADNSFVFEISAETGLSAGDDLLDESDLSDLLPASDLSPCRPNNRLVFR